MLLKAYLITVLTLFLGSAAQAQNDLIIIVQWR